MWRPPLGLWQLFLDLPYTETMTYCSYLGEHDPLSDVGNARGFSLDAIYLKNAEYANDTERAFIEFCMRDAYKFYGYDFEYWDGQPVDEERLNKWLTSFSIIDALIEQTRRELYQADSFMVLEDLGLGIEIRPLYSGFSKSS